MKVSAFKYYFCSLSTIFNNINYWSIPKLIKKDPVLIKVLGNKFLVSNLMDIWTLKEVCLDEQYNIYRKIQKNDIIIDIGASIGDFSIKGAKIAKKVFAYELNPERILLFKKNYVLNKVKNIDINPIKASSLDEIFEKKKINKCNFLKIDCEGCEYEIFNNTSDETLKKIDYMAMEIHLFNPKMKADYENLKQRLKDNDFAIKEVPNQVHKYIQFTFAKRIVSRECQ